MNSIPFLIILRGISSLEVFYLDETFNISFSTPSFENFREMKLFEYLLISFFAMISQCVSIRFQQLGDKKLLSSQVLVISIKQLFIIMKTSFQQFLK